MPRLTLRSGLALLGLIGFGFSVNLFSMLNGIPYFFGGIAVLIIVSLYGMTWGAIASLISCIYGYIALEHSYGIIVFLSEALFVGYFVSRKKQNILLMDGIFWVALGMPMIWLFYHSLLSVDVLFVKLFMLTYSICGLFNTLLASLVLRFVPLRRWITPDITPYVVPLRQTVFELLVTSVLLPSLILTYSNSMADSKRGLDQLSIELTQKTSDLSIDLNTFVKQKFELLTDIGSLVTNTDTYHSEDLLRDMTAQSTLQYQYRFLFVTDSAGKTVATYPAKNSLGASLVGLDLSNRPFFKDSEPTSQVIVSDPFMESDSILASDTPVSMLKAPILQKGRLVGYVVGALDTQTFNEFLRARSNHGRFETSVTDGHDSLIATTQADGKIGQPYLLQNGKILFTFDIKGKPFIWQPENNTLPEVRAWMEFVFIQKHPLINGMTLIVQDSGEPYKNGVITFYSRNLQIVLGLSLLTFLLAILVSTRFTRPLSKLAQLTTHLPNELLDQQTMEWPKSSVQEMDSLVHNFRSMTGKIKQMFQEINQVQDTLVHLAHYDSLTELPNRVLLRERLISSLEQAGQHHHPVAILFIDLDRFKIINDTLGHNNGDLLLKKIAERLLHVMPSDVIVGHQGADEFMIILPQLHDNQEVGDVAQMLLDAMKQPFMLGEQELFITTSIGISVSPTDAVDVDTLMKNADTAMYRAKELGGDNYQFYTSAMNDRTYDRLKLENSMRRALEREEFLLYYQPKVDILTRQIVGMEALIRWLHPEWGLVSPGQFIPLAEETGLIIPIGEWALRTACAQNKAWQDAGLPPLRVAVNLSVRQFQIKGLVDMVARVLEETGLDPTYLELEITESLAMNHAEHTIDKMQRLKNLGIQLSIDDFGTGYSSLNYLKRFPVDTLKIDQAFIRDIGADANDERIVKAMITLAHSFQMKAIAEGVETEAQFAFLLELQCDEIQGYLFSKPVPAPAFEQMLRQQEAQKEDSVY